VLIMSVAEPREGCTNFFAQKCYTELALKSIKSFVADYRSRTDRQKDVGVQPSYFFFYPVKDAY